MTLPRTGPLPRPASVEEAALVLCAEALDAPNVQRVHFAASEFTSVCPRTAQPDFSTIEIEYEPSVACLESKALKLYLWAYRDVGAFAETLAANIADDIVEAIAPQSLTVTVRQGVRGGIALTATATR